MFKSCRKFQFVILTMMCVVVMVTAVKKSGDDKEKPAWAKKKITDYSDADMERLLDQWNVSHQSIHE